MIREMFQHRARRFVDLHIPKMFTYGTQICRSENDEHEMMIGMTSALRAYRVIVKIDEMKQVPQKVGIH